MRALFSLIILATLSTTSVDAQEPRCDQEQGKMCFTGKFDLVPADGEATKKMLGYDFGFRDHNGLGWETRRGDITDGASIPRFFHPFIGDNWDQRYIRAAVIHDRYCDVINSHNVRSWQDTHRMFYDALIASGVEKNRAALMYYAVYNFGPWWDELSEGTKCRATEACIQVAHPKKILYLFSNRYDDPALAKELEAVGNELDLSGPESGTPDKILEISLRRHPTRTERSPNYHGTPDARDR